MSQIHWENWDFGIEWTGPETKAAWGAQEGAHIM